MVPVVRSMAETMDWEIACVTLPEGAAVVVSVEANTCYQRGTAGAL